MRRLAGGVQQGAFEAVSEDSERGVLKTSADASWTERTLAAEPAVARARAAGYPTPAWLATGTTADGAGWFLQETVLGEPIETLDLEHAGALVAVLERQAGIDPWPERCWSDFLAERLRRDVADLAVEATSAGEHGVRLATAARRLLDAAGDVRLPRTDLVHGDFRPGNVLVEGTRIAGVVDVEALGSGSRSLDYATLLDHPSIEPDALALLVEAGADAAGPGALLASFAWVSLELARFVRVREDPATSDARLRLLAERAGQLEHIVRARTPSNRQRR